MAGMISVGRNHHGNLRFRLYWNGLSSTEGIALKDTPENRAKVQPKVDQINAEIKAGTFDYLAHFPQGNKAEYFEKALLAKQPKTIRRYYEDWITKFEPPLGKKSRYRNYKGHFDNHILPAHGNTLLTAFRVAEIRALLNDLVQVKHLSVKSAKNALNGSLRALFRDAQSEGLIERNPFELLPRRWWPKTITPTPDPFDESERDRILEYFKAKFGTKWRAGYAFIYTLFWGGMRPSELTARRWCDLDPVSGKLAITTSRTLGEESETKTLGSNRTIQLFPPVLEVILSIKPLRVNHDDHIFLQRNGRPINQFNFGDRHFQGALTALKIRHRDFYHTRHTFISILLLYGENPKAISDYVGNSPEVIFKHYARWLGGTSEFGRRALEKTFSGGQRNASSS